MPQRRISGNLVLILAIFMVGILIFSFVALNYNQMFTHQKQAQTAIDAAALAVARQLGSVTYLSPRFGRISVADDYVTGGTTSTTGGMASSPVLGINTLVARNRLDRIIISQLNNNTLLFLANADYNQIVTDLNNLNDTLTNLPTSTTFVDKNGTTQPLNLKQIAANAYNKSGLRVASAATVPATNFTITIGNITGNSGKTATNIPVPNTFSQTSANQIAQWNSRSYYRANVNIPAQSTNYIFSMIGDQPTIVDQSTFQPGSAITWPQQPVNTVVKVSVNEQVKAITGGGLTASKTEVACAEPGGRRVNMNAGIFRLEFPQGIPQNNNGINYSTVQSLLNSSQLPANATSSTPPPSSGWNGNGRFFTAVGAPFPGSGSVQLSGIEGRTKGDNPSVALAYYVYDWLRNDGLRPDPQSILSAFQKPLRTTPVGETTAYTNHGNFLIQSAYAACDPPRSCNVWGGIFDLVPNSDIAMVGNTSTKQDPRSLIRFSPGTRNEFWDQAMSFRMQASVPQQLGYAANSTMCHGLDNAGNPSTVDCNPITELLDFREDLGNQLRHSVNTAIEAKKVTDEQYPEIVRITNLMQASVNRLTQYAAQMRACGRNRGCYNAARSRYNSEFWNVWYPLYISLQEPTRKFNRGATAFANANSAALLANHAASNLKAITSLGVDKTVNTAEKAFPGGYVVASLNGSGFKFFPPGRYALKSEIEGRGTVSTGQQAGSNGDQNWCGSPAFIAELGTLLPRLCTPDTRPSSQSKNFKFVTVGSAAESGDSKDTGVTVVVENSVPKDFPDVSRWFGPLGTQYTRPSGDFAHTTGISALLEGQSQYQALNVFSEPPSPLDNRMFVVWSVMAQDNARNISGDHAGDLNDDKTAGNERDCGRFNKKHQLDPVPPDPIAKSCDAEASRFQVTSPLLYTTIKIPTITLPPPPPTLPAIPIPPPPPPSPPSQSH